MDTSKTIIAESARLLEQQAEFPGPLQEFQDKEELIRCLERVVSQLLNRDFERLLRLCYRIDLSETKLKNILRNSSPEKMAWEISEAIVDRQILKIETRRKYR